MKIQHLPAIALAAAAASWASVAAADDNVAKCVEMMTEIAGDMPGDVAEMCGCMMPKAEEAGIIDEFFAGNIDFGNPSAEVAAMRDECMG